MELPKELWLAEELGFALQLTNIASGKRKTTCKGTWLFDHVVLRDQVANYNRYISNTTVVMITKLGRIVSYLKRLLIIKLLDPLVTCSC